MTQILREYVQDDTLVIFRLAVFHPWNRSGPPFAGSIAAHFFVIYRAAIQENQSMAGPTIETDVLVCGGGCAGLAAALAAARNGAKTLMIERAGFAGGIVTAVGLPYFDGMYEKKSARKVVRGIAEELIELLPHFPIDMKHVCVPIKNIERFKLVSDRLLQAERGRLDVLFHSFACDVKVESGRIAEVRVANKDGLVTIKPKVVIDATGDGDIAAWSGAPVIKTHPLQPMTLHFRIGNVQPNEELNNRCRAECEAALKAGEIKSFYGPGIMFMFAENEIYLHVIRVPGDASSAADLTRAEMQARSDAWVMFERWKKSVPGMEDSYFLAAAPYIGVRETRRIVGQHVISEQDIKADKRFDDAIATGCWYLDVHPQEATSGDCNTVPSFWPNAYDIPHRSILPQTISNLLVAGRCHSATAMAAASTRVTVTAMALGEAAGCAAAMGVAAKKEVAEMSGVAVRESLARQNAGPFTDAEG